MLRRQKHVVSESRPPSRAPYSLRSSLMRCSRSLKSRAKSQPQGSDFKLFQKIKRLNVTKSFIKHSGQLLENFFGLLSSGMTSSIRSRSFRDHSSTRQIRTSKSHSLAQVCQSDKRLRLRHGASASNQQSRGQVPGSICQLFRFRLGRLSKIKEANAWFICFQYSMPIFFQPAELRLQLLIHQQRVNSMR